MCSFDGNCCHAGDRVARAWLHVVAFERKETDWASSDTKRNEPGARAIGKFYAGVAGINAVMRIEFEPRAGCGQCVVESSDVNVQGRFTGVVNLPTMWFRQANCHRLEVKTSRDVARE